MDARNARLVVAACAATVILLGFTAPAIAATVTVNTTTDEYDAVPNSTCSLREAIKSVDGNLASDATGIDFGGCIASGSYANGAGTPDTIMLPEPGTYQLNRPGMDDSDDSGDLDVFRSMNIAGSGNSTVQQTVAGQRVIDTTATGKVLSISGLTITGGDQGGGGNGGGIRYDGGAGSASLTLDGVTVTGNDTSDGGSGGGIWTNSATAITNSVISGNKAAKTTGAGNGGGIYQDGVALPSTGVTLALDHTSVTGNFAGSIATNGSGGGIYRIAKTGDPTSTASIQDSDISGNTARFFGGGIFSQSDATLDVKRSLISGNSALSLRGGGIDGESQTTSTGQINLVDTTVTGNSSNAEGGGVMTGNSSAINLSLLFTTLAGNASNGVNSGSELYFGGNTSPKPNLVVEASVFAATNPVAMNACAVEGTNYVNRVDNGYNVSTDPTESPQTSTTTNGCSLASPLQPGDRTGVDSPLLEALADNGGPTRTMQAAPSSLLLDNVPNAVCTAIALPVTTDQRGYPRPDASGFNCDTGAYEAFICNGSALNAPGAFAGCPAPPPTGTGGAGGTPSGPTAQPKKKCKKKKHRAAAAKKKCKKKKK